MWKSPRSRELRKASNQQPGSKCILRVSQKCTLLCGALRGPQPQLTPRFAAWKTLSRGPSETACGFLEVSGCVVFEATNFWGVLLCTNGQKKIRIVKHGQNRQLISGRVQLQMGECLVLKNHDCFVILCSKKTKLQQCLQLREKLEYRGKLRLLGSGIQK